MKKQMKLAIGVFLFWLILLPISFGFSTEIYKWTDKDGKLIFSDTPPPPGVDSEIKKFEEPQSKEKPKPQTVPSQPKLDASPPPRIETATKKPQPEPTVKEKAKLQADSPQPKSESFKEKRPYESVNVIMYMTAW
jgi:Domain of unknown function (DUF4124)